MIRGAPVRGVLACVLAASWPIVLPAGDVPLGGHDVVILGEHHDNPAHHLNQARWVEDLRPRALVFEMLTPEGADAAERARGGGLGAVEVATGWADSGWPDFALYAPIFAAGGAAAWFGGDVAQGDLRRAVEAGAAEALGDSASLFGLADPLDPGEQAARETMQAAAHCDALPVALLPGMVEAQRLRDAALARAVIVALAEVGPPVAVITGNGHARTDWGMPRALRHARPDLSILSVGQIEGTPEAAPPYDAWVAGPAFDRGDPCAAFR